MAVETALVCSMAYCNLDAMDQRSSMQQLLVSTHCGHPPPKDQIDLVDRGQADLDTSTIKPTPDKGDRL
jgi:hypothetical protein